jgi:hypothetical protein
MDKIYRPPPSEEVQPPKSVGSMRWDRWGTFEGREFKEELLFALCVSC